MGDFRGIAKVLRGKTAVVLTVAVGVTAGGIFMSGTAQAEYEYHPYRPGPFTAFPSTTQAGGHPDLHIHFVVENHFQEEYETGIPSVCNCEDARDVTTSLPAGVIGNPNNVPRCSQVDFNNGVNCSPDTQVGVAFPALNGNPNVELTAHTPIYNLVPHPDQAGLLGFFLPLANTPAYIVLSARTGGDFGLDSKVVGIEHLIPIDGFGLDLWGVPADPSHDSERCTSFEKLNTGGFRYECQPGSSPQANEECPVNCPGSTGPSNAELKPFLDNPTTCTKGLFSSIEVLFYNGKETEEEDAWPTGTGCDLLTFNPSLFAQPTTTSTDSPSGLDVDLRVPQLQSPSAPSPSEMRTSVVTLPVGMSINPNAADGKTTCSDAQARFGTEEEANCPEQAKVGTLSLTSTALPEPIPGAIYLGESKSGDRYRLILTANGFATHVKLAGSVKPDPQTGQLVVSFKNLPQAPFSDLNLHFFGSERGLLATPTHCGTYAVTSTFSPWDEALSEQTSTQYFDSELRTSRK